MQYLTKRKTDLSRFCDEHGGNRRPSYHHYEHGTASDFAPDFDSAESIRWMIEYDLDDSNYIEVRTIEDEKSHFIYYKLVEKKSMRMFHTDNKDILWCDGGILCSNGLIITHTCFFLPKYYFLLYPLILDVNEPIIPGIKTDTGYQKIRWV